MHSIRCHCSCCCCCCSIVLDAMTGTSSCSATTQPQHSCSCSINIFFCCCCCCSFARMCLHAPVCMPCVSVSVFVCVCILFYLFFTVLPVSGRCGIVVVLVCCFNVAAVSFAHTHTHVEHTFPTAFCTFLWWKLFPINTVTCHFFALVVVFSFIFSVIFCYCCFCFLLAKFLLWK